MRAGLDIVFAGLRRSGESAHTFIVRFSCALWELARMTGSVYQYHRV